MNFFHKLALLLIAGFASSCTPLPETQSSPLAKDGQVLIEDIQDRLPGTYSNFAQSYEEDGDGPVTDINIRQLHTDGEPVFLFESQQRESDTSSHDIYWLKLNHQSRQAEFHFAHLRLDELSLPIPEILSSAWQRVEPGCVIVMTPGDDQPQGHTNPDTCLFEHLLQGETRLYRALSIGKDTLDIENALTVSSGQDLAESTHFRLQKHRTFDGWASNRTPAGPDQSKPGEWQLSTIFSLRDDGRIKKLYDHNGDSLDYGLKLAKLPRKKGEPPYMLLTVINMDAGGIQAYTWFDPSSERFDLNLDWFQTNVELVKPTNPEN